MQATYRRAKEKDISKLSAHRVIFLNEVFGINTHPDEAQLKKELHDYFLESMGDGSLIAWIAEYEQQIISTSTLVIWKAPLSYAGLGKKGKRAYILNMYTQKEYRKKGIASVLLDKLIIEARKIGLEYVHLHATNDGMRLYKEKGFEEPLFPELKLKISNE